MRSDLKTGHTQKNTERAGQAEKALYLLNTISAITEFIVVIVRIFFYKFVHFFIEIRIT